MLFVCEMKAFKIYFLVDANFPSIHIYIKYFIRYNLSNPPSKNNTLFKTSSLKRIKAAIGRMKPLKDLSRKENRYIFVSSKCYTALHADCIFLSYFAKISNKMSNKKIKPLPPIPGQQRHGRNYYFSGFGLSKTKLILQTEITIIRPCHNKYYHSFLLTTEPLYTIPSKIAK